VAPSSAPHPATVGQWIYALVCAGLCVLIFFPVLHAARDYMQYGLIIRDCGTGAPTGFDVFSKAVWWAVPVAQFLCVRNALWGRAPMAIMRCAAFASCATAGALCMGLLIASNASRHIQ